MFFAALRSDTRLYATPILRSSGSYYPSKKRISRRSSRGWRTLREPLCLVATM